MKNLLLLIGVLPIVAIGGRSDWPALRVYEGEALRRVKMPIGGIGTGTISLSGRGSLVDWELDSHPDKGHVPQYLNWAPHFAIRVKSADGTCAARILEGPLRPEEYEGETGCPVPNQGFPRFRSARFHAAYPLARIELADPAVPVGVSLEAMNPLVPGDADASGIPAALFRWRVGNPTSGELEVSIAGTVVLGSVDLSLAVAEAEGVSVSEATSVRCPGWNVALDRYWRRFCENGEVGDTATAEPVRVPVRQKCVRFTLPPGGERVVPFALGWRQAKRPAWDDNRQGIRDDVGNYYATRFPTAESAAKHLLSNLPDLERKTLAFVRGVLATKAPEVVKEAALFNLSTFRTETCHRTADGHFFGWEGCYNNRGACMGSCTHVWGYEHALVDLWPDLARDMLDLQFDRALDPETGHMCFRIGQPLDKHARNARGFVLAAADGQMQCLVKAFEYVRKTGDVDWLKAKWPRIRKALEFCWVKGGWDADADGVMEGCQHNTMDVEYFGPNPQMEFLYLAGLSATAAMARMCGDDAFAQVCEGLREKGRAWTEENLFNGEYYEHRIVPPKEPIAEGLRHKSYGARDLADPDYQLGAGCLIDQLIGDFSARAAGLAPVADPAHERTTLRAVLTHNRKCAEDDRLNNMRGYALAGEESLRMAWYPDGRMPRSPFPYYLETMTGFEYVVAGLLAMNGDREAAERVVRNIRSRYDGVKRNPFDEAECGHHYVRALAAWTVLRAFE